MQNKYHICFGKRRTTVVVDNILSEMMAIKLGIDPASEEAYQVIREWLQKTIPEKLGNTQGRKNASQWTRRYLIEEIADKIISNSWLDWTLNYSKKERSSRKT